MTPEEMMKSIDRQFDAIKEILGAQHEQYNKDQIQRDEWHKQHFLVHGKVAQIEASLYGVEGQDGLHRRVGDLKILAHAPPCPVVSSIQTKLNVGLWLMGGIPAVAGLVFGAVELYKKLHP